VALIIIDTPIVRFTYSLSYLLIGPLQLRDMIKIIMRRTCARVQAFLCQHRKSRRKVRILTGVQYNPAKTICREINLRFISRRIKRNNFFDNAP